MIDASAPPGRPRQSAASATATRNGVVELASRPGTRRAGSRSSSSSGAGPIVTLGDEQRHPARQAVAPLRHAARLRRDPLLGPSVGLLPFAQLEAVRDAVRADERAVRPRDADFVGDGHALPDGLEARRGCRRSSAVPRTRFTYPRPMSSALATSRAIAIASSSAGDRAVAVAGHRPIEAERVERVALDLAGADLARHRDGLLAQRHRLRPAVEQHQDLAVARTGRGPAPASAGRPA